MTGEETREWLWLAHVLGPCNPRSLDVMRTFETPRMLKQHIADAVRLHPVSYTHLPVAADRLLIVTFMRAAAEELRGRIAARLADRLAEEPHSAFLRRQRILLGRAPICTVDAFCMQLLKTWFAKLDLPPDFPLADDATAHELREAALAQTMEEFAADEEFRAFADLYGRARTDAAAAAAVLKFYEFSRTLPHPAKVRERVCTDWETREPLAQTAWGKALLREGEKLSLIHIYIEREHEARYRALSDSIKNGTVFARETEQVWVCSNCGHIHICLLYTSPCGAGPHDVQHRGRGARGPGAARRNRNGASGVRAGKTARRHHQVTEETNESISRGGKIRHHAWRDGRAETVSLVRRPRIHRGSAASVLHGGRPRRDEAGIRALAQGPVSYTHLDVYKRQL